MGEHGGWRIERRPPGFEFTPGLLGKITTFVAIPPSGGWAIFAFMYSFLVTGGPSSKEDELAEGALLQVRREIDGGTAEPGAEHTYELAGNAWQAVTDPKWWISVARQG